MRREFNESEEEKRSDSMSGHSSDQRRNSLTDKDCLSLFNNEREKEEEDNRDRE